MRSQLTYDYAMNKFFRVVVWIIVIFGVIEVVGGILTLLIGTNEPGVRLSALIFWIIVELLLINLLKKDAAKRNADRDETKVATK